MENQRKTRGKPLEKPGNSQVFLVNVGEWSPTFSAGTRENYTGGGLQLESGNNWKGPTGSGEQTVGVANCESMAQTASIKN